tara:strand:- start:2152 stop:2859 length:708 start_codon:yes stop_codon:yes gene_type:complete
MAFKMNGMSFGEGTGYNSALPKKTRAERLKERSDKLNERASDLEKKDTSGMSENRKRRIELRAKNKRDKAARKANQSKNVAAGKKAKANESKNVTRRALNQEVATSKKKNENAVKTDVTRTRSKVNANKGVNEVKATVTKKKSGVGVNKTISKKVNKPKNEAPKKKELTFGQAFKQARSAGAKTFTWKGKSYHTRQKEENKNYVDKSKGVQGPQTQAAQKWEDSRKTPLKKKKKY